LVDGDEDINGVLTDDLLESSDYDKKKKTNKKQPKKILTKRKTPVKRAPPKKTTQTKLNLTKTQVQYLS
jgi:hypothetical protein